jgi:hypothetical protein
VYITKPDAVRVPLVMVYPLSRVPNSNYAKPDDKEFFHRAQFQVELYTKVETVATEKAVIDSLAAVKGVVTISGAVYQHDSDVLRTIYTVVTTGG